MDNEEESTLSTSLMGVDVNLAHIENSKLFHKFLQEEEEVESQSEETKGQSSELKNKRAAAVNGTAFSKKQHAESDASRAGPTTETGIERQYQSNLSQHNGKSTVVGGNNQSYQSPREELRKQYYSPPRSVHNNANSVETIENERREAYEFYEEEERVAEPADSTLSSVENEQKQYFMSVLAPSATQEEQSTLLRQYSSADTDRELTGFSEMIPNAGGAEFYNSNVPVQFDSSENDYALHASLPNDVYELKTLIVESRKELNKLRERASLSDRRCSDLQVQLERQTHSYESFRQKVLQDDQRGKVSTLDEEQYITDMQEKIFEAQREQEILRLECDKLRVKLEHEIALRARAEDVAREGELRTEELSDECAEKERAYERKEDECVHLKEQIDELKARATNLEVSLEKEEERHREYRDSLSKDIEERESNARKVAELVEKNQHLVVELEKIREENHENNKIEYERDSELELLKNDLYSVKELNLEKNEREINTEVELEKASIEVEQLRGLLARSEAELRSLRDHNDHLMRQITDIAREKSIAHHYYEPPLYNNNVEEGQRAWQGGEQELDSFERSNGFSEGQEDTPKQQNFNRGDVPSSKAEPQTSLSPPHYEQLPPAQETNHSKGFVENEKPLTQAHSPGRRRFNLKPNDHQIFPSTQQDEQPEFVQEGRGGVYENQEIQYNESVIPAYNDLEGRMTAPAAETTQSFEGENPVAKAQEATFSNQFSVRQTEDQLMRLNMQKTNLDAELRKLEDSKTKTGATIRRKNEIAEELQEIDNNISNLKSRLKELNAWKPY